MGAFQNAGIWPKADCPLLAVSEDKQTLVSTLSVVRSSPYSTAQRLCREERITAAFKRLNDPYFIDGQTGRNVANDELLALAYAAYLGNVQDRLRQSMASELQRWISRTM